jgi:hypothetical protein
MCSNPGTREFVSPNVIVIKIIFDTGINSFFELKINLYFVTLLYTLPLTRKAGRSKRGSALSLFLSRLLVFPSSSITFLTGLYFSSVKT